MDKGKIFGTVGRMRVGEVGSFVLWDTELASSPRIRLAICRDTIMHGNSRFLRFEWLPRSLISR